jgi:hypothetical protein
MSGVPERRSWAPKIKKIARSKGGTAAITGAALILPIVALDWLADDLGSRFIARLLDFMLPDLPKQVSDVAPGAYGYLHEMFAVILYNILVGGVLIVQYIHKINLEITTEVARHGTDIVEATARFGELDEAVRDLSDSRHAAYRERVTFGLFDNLIIYAPLYIAKGLGYFDDELLDPRPRKIGDDHAVAKAVREGAVQFGVCDPVCCVPRSFYGDKSEDDLLILTPLTKKFGISIFGRRIITPKALIEQAGPFKIGTYENGSTTYLTAERFRNWLIDSLAGEDESLKEKLGKKIILETIGVMSTAFEQPTLLDRRVRNLAFILLWQPQSSWIFTAQRGGLSEFGIVQVPEAAGAPIEELFRVANGSEPADQWKAWTPYNGRQMPERCLVSAVVTTRYMVQHRPELCRRVFRAVSRAMVRLHNSDWTLDGLDTKNAIYGVLRREVRHAEYLDPEIVRAMAGAQNAAVESTFPFISGLSSFSTSTYSQHLRQCHFLWLDAKGDLPPLEEESMYGRCFVDPRTLLGTAA